MSSATFVCRTHRQLVHSCRWKLVYSDLARLISSAAWAVKPMSDTTHHCYCHRQSPSSPLMSTFYSTNASNQSLSLPISTRYQQTHAATPRPEASPPIDTLTIELGETHRQNEMSKVKELLLGIRRGDRAKLAAAITLVESRHPLKHKQAQWLLTKILSQQSKRRQLGALRPTFRIGLSGPPGAGKSTLIESFGQLLTGQGYKVAVLAVDPSSTRTGGSILGDKTRMIKLTNDPNAYIRPSPSGGSLGGVTRSTSEAITLCEGAGYDIIVVETVGVGQSETAVCDMVDMFVLMTPPAAGDELQGMKKGIVELADLILINKADGDLLPAARRIKGEYVSALRLIRSKTPHWQPKVLMLSALSNQGVKEMWNVMQEYWQKMKEVQQFDTTRKNQQRQWLWNHIGWQLKARFKSHPGMPEQIVAMEKRVMAGSLAPGTAADILLDEFIQGCSHGNIK